jgi:hypothetical protein
MSRLAGFGMNRVPKSPLTAPVGRAIAYRIDRRKDFRGGCEGERQGGCLTGILQSLRDPEKFSMKNTSRYKKLKIFDGTFSGNVRTIFHDEPGLSSGNYQECYLSDNLFCPELCPDLFGKVFSHLS